MISRNNAGFLMQLAAVFMMPALFTFGIAVLPILLAIYALVINLRRLSNWLVDAVLGIGDE